MASSQLQLDNRTSLYFGKYKYRSQCKVMGAVYTYYTNSLEQFLKKLEATKANRNSYRISIINSRFEETYDKIDLEVIGKFFQWKNSQNPEKFMYRVQGNMVSFFSNDYELLKTLTEIDPEVKHSEAFIEATNVLYFKREPKYKYRTFFKGRKVPVDFNENITNLINMYGDKIHFSPGMVRTLTKQYRTQYRYMHTSYYIDYNDPSMLTIFGLWFGDFLGKTYSMEKIKG